MDIKQKLISAYLILVIAFATYGTFFGDFSNHGFFFNLGRGLLWPAIILPSLGWLIGAIIIIVFVVLVTAL